MVMTLPYTQFVDGLIRGGVEMGVEEDSWSREV